MHVGSLFPRLLPAFQFPACNIIFEKLGVGMRPKGLYTLKRACYGSKVTSTRVSRFHSRWWSGVSPGWWSVSECPWRGYSLHFQSLAAAQTYPGRVWTSSSMWGWWDAFGESLSVCHRCFLLPPRSKSGQGHRMVKCDKELFSKEFLTLHKHSLEYSIKIYILVLYTYKYPMRFRVPALDQSDCSICYNYDLMVVSLLNKIKSNVWTLRGLYSHSSVMGLTSNYQLPPPWPVHYRAHEQSI